MQSNISYGDKILATVTTHNGNIIVRIATEKINSTKELMLKIRELTQNKHIRISTLFIRNLTQGWSINQPLLIA